MDFTVGKRFKDTMAAIKGYHGRFTKYIESQQESGYLRLLPASDLDDNYDTISFRMGQYGFIFQMIAVPRRNQIMVKTYRLPKYPETTITHIPEMDIVCNDVSATYDGISRFVTPQKTKTYWDKEEEFKYFQEIFTMEYLFFLERHMQKHLEQSLEGVKD